MKFFAVLLAAFIGFSAAQATDFENVDVIILGEVHDNPDAHIRQAEFLREIVPTAVVFEMLSPAAAAAANQVDRTDLFAIAEATAWSESGWPDFELYAPVFEALGDAHIVGAAVPRDVARQAISSNAYAVFGSNGARFGLDRSLHPDQRKEREQLQFEAHCEAMPLGLMAGFVEAQRLRDAVFAEALLNALGRHGAPVVLIAGNGHARTDWGVPASIRSADQDVSVFSIAMAESESEAPFDQVVVVPPADRPDPCETL